MDIANISQGAVDLQKGRLVHKRIKTHEQSNVPTIEYKLWLETLDLLRKFRSSHPDLVLVSMKAIHREPSPNQAGLARGPAKS
ncbi:MAG TPA: hypothetical protein VN688_00080 [Gemmataceae bacterium]|nr:hypothetical protein [Gemmataceae bacterium]